MCRVSWNLSKDFSTLAPGVEGVEWPWHWESSPTVKHHKAFMIKRLSGPDTNHMLLTYTLSLSCKSKHLLYEPHINGRMVASVWIKQKEYKENQKNWCCHINLQVQEGLCFTTISYINWLNPNHPKASGCTRFKCCDQLQALSQIVELSSEKGWSIHWVPWSQTRW